MKSKNVAAVKLVRKLMADAHTQGCFEEVWALVTALRGPDDENHDLKSQTTTKIRMALCTYNQVLNAPIDKSCSFPDRHVTRRVDVPDGTTTHFSRHIRKAVAVLNGK